MFRACSTQIEGLSEAERRRLTVWWLRLVLSYWDSSLPAAEREAFARRLAFVGWLHRTGRLSDHEEPCADTN